MAKLKQLKSKLNTLNPTRSSLIVKRITGRELQAIRDRILLRDNFTCRICGNQYIDSFLEIDHIVPLAIGGQEIDENRQCVCVDCHKIKSDKERKEYGF